MELRRPLVQRSSKLCEFVTVPERSDLLWQSECKIEQSAPRDARTICGSQEGNEDFSISPVVEEERQSVTFSPQYSEVFERVLERFCYCLFRISTAVTGAPT